MFHILMRLIDCHSHVNFSAYRDDASAVIAAARAKGIGMLAVGSQRTTSERAVETAEREDGVWAVIGLHPVHVYSQHVDEEEDSFQTREETFDVEFYRGLGKRSKKVVAIGECGLDYYRLPEEGNIDEIKRRQHAAFRAQLDLAHELGLPVMIHCRNAIEGGSPSTGSGNTFEVSSMEKNPPEKYSPSSSRGTTAHSDIATILEEYASVGKSLRGDVHCFTGTWAEAQRYLTLGFYVSFTGIITFPPRKEELGQGETLQDVVRRVPLDRLLVETDAPYLAPVPFRGKRNEPAYVEHVAAKVAELKGLSFDEVARQTTENAVRLFGIV